MPAIQYLALLTAVTILFIAPLARGEAALWEAAAGGDTKRIQELLESGADINATHGDDKTTPLMKAAEKNHLKAVQQLVERGAELELYSGYGGTALGYAARGADLPVLKYLLEQGAKINGQYEDGYTPLMYAANKNKPEIVQWLIDRGADLHFATPTGWNAVHVAAIRNKPKNIEVLIRAGLKPSPRSRGHWTPLMVAAEHGTTEAAKALLAAGADPSESDGGTNAIVTALVHSRYDIARLLVDAGADLRGTDYIDAPLIYAASKGRLELTQQMIDRGAEVPKYRPGVYGAALNGHYECVELLSSYGAQIHEKDWKKVEQAVLKNSDVRSHIAIIRVDYQKDAKDDAEHKKIAKSLEPAFAIMRAAHEGRTDDVTSLIDDAMKQSPWAVVAAQHYAKKEGRIDTIRVLKPVYYKAKRLAERKPSDLKTLTRSAEANDAKRMAQLLKSGADPNYGNPKEYSPMMIVIEGHRPELVKLLLDHGADPNRDPGWNDRSPLAQACYRGTPEIVKLLIDAGADPDQGGDGMTPLYFSAGKGDLESIKLLLDAGADINLGCRSHEQRTALIEAAYEGHAEAVALLAQRGADLDQQDVHGLSPAEAAASNAHATIAIQLIRLGATPPQTTDDLRPRITLPDVSRPDRLKMLLANGADPNAKTVKGYYAPGLYRTITPLNEILSDTGINHECVKLLLDAGAKLSLVDGPLVRSIHMSEQTIDLLVEAGADPNQADPWFDDGARPIHLAAAFGRSDLIRRLLDAGANPELRAVESKLTLEQYVMNFNSHINDLIRKERIQKAKEVIAQWRAEKANKSEQNDD